MNDTVTEMRPAASTPRPKKATSAADTSGTAAGGDNVVDLLAS